MKFLSLIFKSARRSTRRTALTVLSVAVAVFLFASLRAVLDGLNAAAAGSSSTRIVTIRSTSLIFPMPTSHANGIRGVNGVQDVTWANWFGGIYKDPRNFFAQFAIEPESYLRMYPEIELPPRSGRRSWRIEPAASSAKGWRGRTGSRWETASRCRSGSRCTATRTTR